MVFGSIVVGLGGSLDNRVKVEAWRDLNQGDMEDLGGHAERESEGT